MRSELGSEPVNPTTINPKLTWRETQLLIKTLRQAAVEFFSGLKLHPTIGYWIGVILKTRNAGSANRAPSVVKSRDLRFKTKRPLISSLVPRPSSQNRSEP